MIYVKERILPQITPEGSVIIPEAAWRSLIRDVYEHFHVVLEVHDHTGPGAYHDDAFIPMAHYLLRLTSSDEALLFTVIEAINPRIDELVETYTEANVPAAR